MEDVAAAKRRAGRSAAATVDDGDVVGLGTGSTAAAAIRALGDRIDSGVDVVGVPTSYQSRAVAAAAGVPLAEIGDRARVDVTIDGADEIAAGAAIKGGGGAHTTEKVVATAADRVVFVVDERKVVDQLRAPVPLAVVPAARATVAARVEELGGEPTLRAADRKDGPVVTDDGNLIIDAAFGQIDAPEELSASLSELPGVVEHGLFVGIADELHVGTADAVTVQQL
ncbi:MAG: ribose-5-phosphate isomerase RpiA [Halobacteriaceae archaeon]